MRQVCLSWIKVHADLDGAPGLVGIPRREGAVGVARGRFGLVTAQRRHQLALHVHQLLHIPERHLQRAGFIKRGIGSLVKLRPEALLMPALRVVTNPSIRSLPSSSYAPSNAATVPLHPRRAPASPVSMCARPPESHAFSSASAQSQIFCRAGAHLEELALQAGEVVLEIQIFPGHCLNVPDGCRVLSPQVAIHLLLCVVLQCSIGVRGALAGDEQNAGSMGTGLIRPPNLILRKSIPPGVPGMGLSPGS